MKKFLPYILISIILVGLFGLTAKEAGASLANPNEPCVVTTDMGGQRFTNIPCINSQGLQQTSPTTAVPVAGSTTPVTGVAGTITTTGVCTGNRSGLPIQSQTACEQDGGKWDATATKAVAPPVNQTPFENALNKHCTTIASGSVGGCLAQLFYFLLYTIPTFLLGYAGKLFNVVIVLALDSATYKTGFVDQAWTVVRDFSNIFFILILLYVAIQTILGMGHETKKVIVQVIIMALLINFSMFFTRVVIDTSNILALVFYNKLNAPQGDTPANIVALKDKSVKEKGISERLTEGFDITRVMSQEFFEQAKNRSGFAVVSLSTGAAIGAGAVAGTYLIPIPVVGTVVGAVTGGFLKWLNSESVPPSLLISILIPAGIILYYAIYAFFTAGIAFLSRIVELWVLMIFAPFAFMSSTLPILKKVSSIGWDEWVKRLFEIAFMAPVFMFFLLLIFKITESDITKGLLKAVRPEQKDQWLLETIVLVSIAAFIILALLQKATKYAKKASGEIGEMVTSGIKLAAGLAVGGAALGTAFAGRAVVGKFMKEASTGDSANQRFARSQVAGAPNEMRGRWDTIKGWAGHNLTGGLVTRAQTLVGGVINRDQTRVERSAHSRHTLDEVAKNRYQGKTYNELSAPERTWVQNRIDQDILTRNRTPIQTMQPVVANGQPVLQANGQPQMAMQNYDYGNRQKFSELSDDAQTALTAHLNAMNPAQRAGIAHGSVQTTREAREKQGIGSTLLQASRTGNYDIRNVADLIAKEQSTGFNKLTVGLMAAVAMGIRGGFKSAGVNYGEGQGNFFKDLGDTVTNALKSAKIDVDLSKVGEVKEEKGGGGGHH